MALDQTKIIEKHELPMERLFYVDGMYKVLDCLLSNYELEQRVEDIINFTRLENSKVDKCLQVLIKKNLVMKQNNTFKAKITSERLAGFFSYYRATMADNLKNIEFKTIDHK